MAAWPELMKIMVDNTGAEQPENVKRASLLALGYMCESADPQSQALVSSSNNILIAIVQGAESTELQSSQTGSSECSCRLFNFHQK